MEKSAQGINAATPQISELATISNRLTAQLGSMHDLRERLMSVLTGAFGEIPTETKKEGPRPVRSGMLGVIEDQLDAVDIVATQLEDISNKLQHIA